MNGGVVFVSMVDERDRKMTQAELSALLRKELRETLNASGEVVDLDTGSGRAPRTSRA